MDGNGHNDVIGRRIGAAVIDAGIVLLLLLLVGALFGNDTADDASVSQRLGPLDSLLFLALAFLYFWGTEATSAQTLGKRVLGLKVVSVDGGPASGRAILVRNLVRFVDALPFFYIAGAIAVFSTGRRRQRLGDLAAKTRVVAIDAAPDEPESPPPPPSDEDVIASVLR
ncbi:MAG: RDD family protein [Solirubrobacterales bacterium]|nr:RDD family protein [Solirubrobacterales bacterium]